MINFRLVYANPVGACGRFYFTVCYHISVLPFTYATKDFNFHLCQSTSFFYSSIISLDNKCRSFDISIQVNVDLKKLVPSSHYQQSIKALSLICVWKMISLLLEEYIMTFLRWKTSVVYVYIDAVNSLDVCLFISNIHIFITELSTFVDEHDI